MNIKNKNALWGFLKIIPIVLAIFLLPVAAFAEGNDGGAGANPKQRIQKIDESNNGDPTSPPLPGDNKDKPVTEERLKQEIAKVKEDTKAEIKSEIKTPPMFKEGGNGEMFLMGAMGLGAAGLILAIVAVTSCGSINTFIKKNVIQKSQVKQLERKLEEYESEIKALKESLAILKAQKAAEPAPTPAPQPIRENVMQRSVPTPPAPDPMKEFLEEYSKLFVVTPFEAKEIRKNLESKYRLKAFSCDNSEARMQNPSIPPAFISKDLATAHVWAFPKGDGNYAAVPKPGSYEETLHDQGAMGEIFNSNFKSGNTYKKIEVIKPAVFAEGWKLIQKGELRLS